MGTVASPNLVFPLIDLSTGALDTGETVVIVLHGGGYPGDGISLTEIGTSGRYKLETAGGVAAVAQGIYEVYVNGTFKGVYTHGYTGPQDHMDSVADPHSVAAAQVSVVDSGSYYAGAEVEAVLQEIGSDIATLASAGSTLLLDNSDQSVDAAKPKVDNLDADQVDGADAGVGAGNVLVLDSSALVPLGNIPDSLTGKDADTVDGKDVGTGAGDIPEMTATGEAGKLDTSLLAKQIGSGDSEIPLISTSQVAGRLDDSLLGIEAGGGAGDIPVLDGDAHVPHANLPPISAMFFGGLKTSPAGGYMFMLDGIQASADNGYVMHRAGSIVGIAGIANTSVQANANKVKVYKNGVSVFLAQMDNGVGWMQAKATQARGVDTFVAGDVLQPYFLLGAGTTSGDVTLVFEVIFD